MTLTVVPNRHQPSREFSILFDSTDNQWALLFRDPSDTSWFVMGWSADETTIRAALKGMQHLQLKAVK